MGPEAAVRLLRAARLVTVDVGNGVDVICVLGRLWVTQTHDLRDLELRAGEQAVFTGPGSLVVQAFADSHVSFTRHH
jgi:hypothetical protein